MRKKLTYAIVLALILMAFAIVPMSTGAEEGLPRVWTDKPDYYPEETVIISGENFTGYDPIEVKITRPDYQVEYANTTADEFGSFTTSYILDGILGEYLVEASDAHGLYAYTTFTDGKPPSLFGWDWKFDDWTKSTLEGYGAGDWVWWHIKLYNEDPGDYKIVWNHDHFLKTISAYGFVEIRNVRLLYEDYPNENETGIDVTVEGPFYPEDPNTIRIEYNASFTIATKGDYYLRWDARLDANETLAWPGKALHTHFETWFFDGDEQCGGQQDVQVEQPLSPPLSKINGYKWHDEDGDGNWGDGEPGLANWTIHLTGTDIYGKNVSRVQLTDENGFYRFAGLIRGNYTVFEDLMVGWTCTNRAGDPPSTGTIQITEDYTNLTHVDFGNTYLTPDIEVVKIGDRTEAHVGETVTYTITVTNTGECTLYNVYVIDTQLGWSVGPMNLSVNESKTYHVNYTITGNEGDPFTNTVTATGENILGETVTDDDDYTINILHPEISVYKTGPAEAHEGDTITYTIVVTNIGDCTLYNVYVNDTKLGWSVGPINLTINQSKTYYVNFTIPVNATDPFTNTVFAWGKDELGKTVSDSDTHTVDILHPGIDVDKTGPAKAHEGDTITFTIVVTNTGDCTLYNVHVNDSKLGWSVGPMTLSVNESKTYYVNYTFTGNEGDPFRNLACAKGTDNLGKTVKDCDCHCVDILHPDIDVEKTGPARAHEGDTITYTIVVKNTGDCTLYNVYVNDTKLGWSVGPMTLSVNESKTYYVNYTFTGNEGDPFRNLACAKGTDILGKTVTDCDCHCVDILHPDIDIEKTGPTRAHEGDTITFTIVVKNTGDCTLYNVYVNDTKLGWSVGPMTLSVNESKTYYVNYTFTGNEGDPFRNLACTKGTDILGKTVTDCDCHCVDILHPEISVIKTGPAEAHEGDTITYTIIVKNTGDCTLYNVYVNDSVLGWSVGPMTLVSDQSITYYVNYTMPVNGSDPFTNTVNTGGKDCLGKWVYDSDNHTVDILHPTIDVTKTGPAEAHEGDTITYTIVVKNTGDCTLYNVYVNDTILGFVAGPMTLTSGQTKTYYVNYTIPVNGSDPLVNTVFVGGKDNLGKWVSDSDSHTVDILHPDITVTKTGPAEAHEGDTITYTIVVKNTGDCTLYNVFLNDTTIGWSAGPMTLTSGQTKTYYVNYTVPVNGSDPLVNTVFVGGKDNLGKWVYDSDKHTVDILHPAIDVTKTGPAEAHEGDTITYTIVVKNTGDCTLYNVYVNDTTLGFVAGPMTLTSDQTKTYYVNYTIPVNGSDPLVNTVFVGGKDNLGKWVYDSDKHTVDILHPAIEVTKTGPAEAHEGDTITYTIVVKNTGDCTLYNVYVNDTTLGFVAGPMTMTSGQTKTYYVNYTVPVNGSDPLVNTVFVGGKDNLRKWVYDSDSHTVDILHPDITVIKTGQAEAHEGDTITYKIFVKNTGDCTLYNVYVNDTTLGFVAGPMTLTSGQTKIYYVNYTIPVNGSDPLVNTVYVGGKDNLGKWVSDSDSHTVDILHPDITVTKTGPAEAHEGDTITYKIVVKNTGDCTLYNVYLNDTLLGTLPGPTNMTSGQTNTYYVNYTIPINGSDPLVNTVFTGGKDNLGWWVSDSDSHTVDILHPDIVVYKSADKTVAHEGDTITYTITVSNTGDCPLYDVTVTDNVLGDLTSYLPDTTLDVGENTTFDVVYIVPTPSGNITNVVTASGTDNLGLTVTDEASWTVIIIHPIIDVIKTADVTYAHWGDNITVNYTFTVKNIGDCILYNVTVIDDKLGDLTSYLPDNILDIGEVNTFIVTESYYIPPNSCELTNIVIASGESAYGKRVSDEDSWTIIALPFSQVTDTSFCYFDRDPNTPGQQFRLLFTQNPHNFGTYKLTASNPGQYYYNVFYLGSEGDEVTLDITIPYPFVTQGAQPIHVYDSVSYGRCGCFKPYGELSGFDISGTDSRTSSGALAIELDDHVNGYVTVTVTGEVPASGLVYVTIHLDFGLKGTRDYERSGGNNAIHPNSSRTINDYSDYEFSVSGDLTDTQVVQNMNVFKRNPGIGGIVLDEFGNPVPYRIVEIWLDGKLIGTTRTDSDGYYFFYWKHKGKEASYTIKLPQFGQEKHVSLKANKFAEVNFEI